MTAAIFGLLGVLVGAIIAGFSTYFMDRRRGWLAARAAGLLTIDDLKDARKDVAAARPDLAAATPAIERSLQSWENHREALLHRRGTTPSGVDAREWLELGVRFRTLRRLADRPDPFADADKAYAELLAILCVFQDDRPAFPEVVRNSVSRLFHPTRPS